MKRLTALIALVVAACGQAGVAPTARPSTTTTPSTIPAQAGTRSMGALVDLGTGPGSTYHLVLVRSDGKVLADLHPATRAPIMATGISAPAAIELPYVSASGDKLYFLDGDSTVKSVDANGNVEVVTNVAGSARVHAAFAVSPDDQQIAVSLIDYSASEPSLHLSIYPLQSRAVGRDLYSSSSNYVWPVAWHRGTLVLAAGAIYSQQGVAWNPYDAASYHVVDPVSLNRIATIGSGDVQGGCQPVGLLAPGGTACVRQSGSIETLDWNGHLVGASFARNSQTMASLSPDGSVAFCCDAAGHIQVRDTSGSVRSTALSGSPPEWACWLDAGHLLSGFVIGGPSFKPSLLDLESNHVTPVDAAGFCAAAFPPPVS